MTSAQAVRDEDIALELRHITKLYSGTVALDDVSLTVRRGEVHGLIGKNGAGKSTLVGVISGIVTPSSGEILVNGHNFSSLSPITAKHQHISIITQEPQVIEESTVAENFFMPLYAGKQVIDWREMARRASAILEEAGFPLDVSTRMRDLSISERQLLLVIKACYVENADIIIMDEVSASLSQKDQAILYQSATLGLLVLGQGVVMMVGELDLSMEATLAFAPGVTILAARQLGLGPAVSILLTLAVGLAIGWFNGFCVAKLQTNSFLLTMSTQIVMRGLVLFLVPFSLAGLDSTYTFLGRGRVGTIQVAILALLVVYAIFEFIFRKTIFGRRFTLTGGNRRAAYISGVNTDRVMILAFVLAGLLSALAGLITAGRQNAVSNSMGENMVMMAFAGAVDLVTLVPGIEKLNEEGIPVFALDTCPEGGHVDMFITNDLVDSSKKAAEQMVEGIKGANNGEVPEGVVIEITGALVDMYTTECHEGFSAVMEQYPQLTVVQGEGNWNNDDSYARTSDLLTRYGDDVVGIYVHTPDIMGSGAVAAVEAAGLDPADYFISGICIGKEGIELLKQGKLYAVVEQPALDSAMMAVEYLNKMFNGEEIPQVGDTITEEGALWSPAYVIENEFADSGATMILQGPLVPQDCDPNDAQLWENRIG